MRRLWPKWVELTSRREDVTGLAVARILLGSTLAFDLARMLWTGAARMSWADLQHGGVRTGAAAAWLVPLGGLSDTNVHVLTAVGAFAAALTALGLFTRVSIFFTWLCFHTLKDVSPYVGGGADTLLIIGLFVLFWSGCGRALSVEQWLRRRRDPNASSEGPAWPRYVLIYQIVTVYWTTGVQKVSNSWWPPPMGTADAIYYILQQPNWQRWVLQPELAAWFRVTQLGTIATWVFELTAPVLLLALWFEATRDRPGRVRAFFNRVRFRRCWLAFGLSLHLGIFALMEVGPFLQSVLVCYCACLHPDDWRWLLKRAASLRRAPAAPSNSASSPPPASARTAPGRA